MEDPAQVRDLLEQERSARAQAERAGRLKDEFLGALAHELRAPLTAILGWSRLLEHGRLGPQELHTGGQTIARNARLLAQIVDDLLDMSALVSGTIRVEAEETDICDVVEAVVDILGPSADSKGVQLEKRLSVASCAVFGDPHRLQQVLWHLVSNALKFTPRGGRACIRVNAEPSFCEIVVEDTGAGIAPELLPHVFERFTRTETAAEQRYTGLGLGLALAKRLVELHGGNISARSEGSSRGSSFTVILPRVAPHADPAREPLRMGRTTARFNADLSGIRVLVVDDEPDTLELLQRVLGDSRAQVAAATSVEAALVTLGSFDPHVLISDVSMPGRDGYELIRAVRATRGPEVLPAAALTAHARPEDAARARAAGFQVHLSKPIEPEALIDVVARLAGRETACA